MNNTHMLKKIFKNNNFSKKKDLPQKVENPIMTTNIKGIKLQDISSYLFSQLIEGEISRFGEGWITRCPECKTLILISNEFKTFSSKEKDLWRIAPSVSCPNEECNWHRSIIIKPEIEVEENENEEEEEEEKEEI